MIYTQDNAPIYEALKRYRSMRVVPFDVPGHKQGRGTPELTEFLGEKCLSVDVNSMKPLDNLCHPTSVILDAEYLAADAFGAKKAFFMVNGASSGVQAMIMSVCKAGDKLILPRNVHRSAINALIISGAVPVYVNPGVDIRLGIPLGMAMDDLKRAVRENPDAKAILINNPTYYGVCSDVREIVRLGHENGMKVLCDEAHGTHFYFGENMPVSGMAAGADMASVSIHKTGGALTQSAFLLANNDIPLGYVRQIINLTQTTSGSYLLMSSLDLARKNLYKNGRAIYSRALSLVEDAREEINRLGGYYAFSSELINGDSVFDFDRTKLSVHTRDIGLAGIEVYDILRDEYNIQTEFGDIGNILAIIALGDRPRDVERLVSALYEIKRIYSRSPMGLLNNEYITPEVIMTPHDAFYADKRQVPLNESDGCVCSEFVMCYPPGIPILAPGERITREILDYIVYAKRKGCLLTGTEDPAVESINIVAADTFVW